MEREKRAVSNDMLWVVKLWSCETTLYWQILFLWGQPGKPKIDMIIFFHCPVHIFVASVSLGVNSTPGCFNCIKHTHLSSIILFKYKRNNVWTCTCTTLLLCWNCSYEMTSTALQPSDLTKAKWSDATSCNGVKQVVSLLFPTYSHIVKFHMKFLLKKRKDLLQQMLPKNKHSGKQLYLSCCTCPVRISHGGFQSRFTIENRMVSFFHVASMTSSFSVLSPQAKEEESEAILATASKRFSAKFPLPQESEKI